MSDVIEGIIQYTTADLKLNKGFKEAILVVFHPEHLVQLCHDVVERRLQKDFLDVFRGFCFIEDDIRKYYKVPKYFMKTELFNNTKLTSIFFLDVID